MNIHDLALIVIFFIGRLSTLFNNNLGCPHSDMWNPK